MAGYSSFSFSAVKKQFGLKSVRGVLFDNLEPIEPSNWLVVALEMASQMAIASEKSRSEWVVGPIMMAIKNANKDKMNIKEIIQKEYSEIVIQNNFNTQISGQYNANSF